MYYNIYIGTRIITELYNIENIIGQIDQTYYKSSIPRYIIIHAYIFYSQVCPTEIFFRRGYIFMNNDRFMVPYYITSVTFGSLHAQKPGGL